MEGLHSNHVLELDTLLLPGNDIGALGCERLASYLKTAPYLHALDLSRNPIRYVNICSCSFVESVACMASIHLWQRLYMPTVHR
jgi:hypothetical protein